MINFKINKNECINTRTPLIKTIVNNSVLPIILMMMMMMMMMIKMDI